MQEEATCEEGVVQAKPRLQLFGTNTEFSCANWWAFKQNYNIISTTMQILFEALGEQFFSSAK